MRAAIVSVDYDDVLRLTLPYNRHHFEEVLIVTTPNSPDAKVAREFGATVFETRSFYDDNAIFNKWKAFEEGLDAFGRHGVLCVMDADILWPKVIPVETYERGFLYSPHRRLWLDVTEQFPSEAFWHLLPFFQDYEFAGYSQIFHADDPHLPSPPWHEQNWIHAGGADSFFQQLWPPFNKRRVEWQVLHLGPPGRNWCGRATPRVDKREIPQAAYRRDTLSGLLNQRPRASRNGGDPYAAERLAPRHNAPAKP